MSEIEFDAIFARIRQRHLTYWADPGREHREQINTWDDGRGVYFEDPNGHLLEVITRPYGSGGTTAGRPHPLVMSAVSGARGQGAVGPGDGASGGALATAEGTGRRPD